MNPAQFHSIAGVIDRDEALDAPSPLRSAALRALALVNRTEVIAAAWFIASFVAMLWVWGTSPTTFPSPDESVNRLAASLVSDTGRPFLAIPHADVEDLAHPRFWLTMDGHAVPAYPPVAYYIFAALTSLPVLGAFAVAALPASALAAFSAGVARLAPQRRILAAVAPAIAFPALYWLLRPWINMSLLLVFLCWAFFAWTRWRTSAGAAWLIATWACIGGAAAIRPDFAPYLFLGALPLALAERPERWRSTAACAVGAALGAVAVNLVLNAITTGDPFRAAYEMYSERHADAEGAVGHGPLGRLYYLLLPWGLPSPSSAVTFFEHYWLRMGPIALLLAGQCALVPLLRDIPRTRRLLYVAAIAVAVAFMLSRMSDTLYGATEPAGLLRHSVPRYWSPVYLFAALPPLLYAARSRNDTLVGIIVCGCAVLAFLGAREIYSGQPESLTYLHNLQARNERRIAQLHAIVPPGAVVYTMNEDKVLWSHWRIGLIARPDETAASVSRSLDAGYPVYIVQGKLPDAARAQLDAALAHDSLDLVTVDAALGVYRAEAASRLSSRRSR